MCINIISKLIPNSPHFYSKRYQTILLCESFGTCGKHSYSVVVMQIGFISCPISVHWAILFGFLYCSAVLPSAEHWRTHVSPICNKPPPITSKHNGKKGLLIFLTLHCKVRTLSMGDPFVKEIYNSFISLVSACLFSQLFWISCSGANAFVWSLLL